MCVFFYLLFLFPIIVITLQKVRVAPLICFKIVSKCLKFNKKLAQTRQLKTLRVRNEIVTRRQRGRNDNGCN